MRWNVLEDMVLKPWCSQT